MSIFNFTSPVILENHRVLLQPLAASDVENLLYFSLNEPILWKYSSIQADGEDNLKNYIDIALRAKHDQKEYPFIVFDKVKNKYAGSTRFYEVEASC